MLSVWNHVAVTISHTVFWNLYGGCVCFFGGLVVKTFKMHSCATLFSTLNFSSFSFSMWKTTMIKPMNTFIIMNPMIIIQVTIQMIVIVLDTPFVLIICLKNANQLSIVLITKRVSIPSPMFVKVNLLLTQVELFNSHSNFSVNRAISQFPIKPRYI